MRTVAQPSATPVAAELAGTHVLVLYEDGPAGTAAIDVANELAERDHGSLTVVSVVPQAVSGCRCGGSAHELNCAVQEAVAEELDHARVRLGAAASRAEYMLLIEGTDPRFETWCAAHRFDVIVLPARRRLLRSRSHPAAARLSRETAAEVRVVDQLPLPLRAASAAGSGLPPRSRRRSRSRRRTEG